MCPECNDRGWIPRFKGDINGDVCMACADDAMRALVSKPPAQERLVKTAGSAPTTDGVRAAGRTGKGRTKAPTPPALNKGAVVAIGARESVPRTLTCSTPGCTRHRANLALYCDECYPREYAKKHRPKGTRTRHTGMTPEEVKEARRMRSGFKTIREIAIHFGVSQETIRTHLKR